MPSQIPDCEIANEFSGFLDKVDRVFAAIAREHDHRRIGGDAIKVRIGREIDVALQVN